MLAPHLYQLFSSWLYFLSNKSLCLITHYVIQGRDVIISCRNYIGTKKVRVETQMVKYGYIFTRAQLRNPFYISLKRTLPLFSNDAVKKSFTVLASVSIGRLVSATILHPPWKQFETRPIDFRLSGLATTPTRD